MIINTKRVAVIEAVLIIFLVGFIFFHFLQENNVQKQKENGFISPRIYEGNLDSKSFMIVNFAPLKENLQNYISKNQINASVYVENMRNGAFMGIGEKNGFFPASLNKLPVAILIMKKVEEGKLTLGTNLKITDDGRTDSFGTLYNAEEKELPVSVLLEKLLRESDNTALRVLLESLSMEDLQFMLDYYGMDIQVKKSGQAYNEDLITPKAISNLYISLYFSTVLEPHNSEYLLSLMNNTVFDINALAGLPEGMKVAHKFGENYYDTNKFFHDCGIMYIDESKILYCVMTKGLEEEKAVEAIGTIVHETYSYVEETRAKFEDYQPKQ